jgi:hypothetical protein
MRFKLLSALVCALLALPGPVSAKTAAVRLTLSGPGTEGPQVTKDRQMIDSITLALLEGDDAIDGSPESTGPAYHLRYKFAVADANGSHTETIRQSLYPFAAGGPVVFTPRRQKIAMSYGPVRFAPGWFEFPPTVVRRLGRLDLPDEPPSVTAPVALASPQVESSGPPVPLFLGLGAALTGAVVLAWRNRRASMKWS